MKYQPSKLCSFSRFVIFIFNGRRGWWSRSTSIVTRVIITTVDWPQTGIQLKPALFKALLYTALALCIHLATTLNCSYVSPLFYGTKCDIYPPFRRHHWVLIIYALYILFKVLLCSCWIWQCIWAWTISTTITLVLLLFRLGLLRNYSTAGCLHHHFLLTYYLLRLTVAKW